MSAPTICDPIHRSTYVPDWGCGRTPSDALGGRTTAQFGQHLSPANLSARQARDLGLLTSGTFGQLAPTSYRSVALALFAENRLRRKTATIGATLYKLTWKDWVTPSGRVFSLLRASAGRGKDTGNGGSGWTTPQAHDSKGGRSKRQKSKHGTTHGCACLTRESDLAGWPTTTVSDAKSSGAMGYGGNSFMTLTDAAKVAGWISPQAGDSKAGRTAGTSGRTLDRSTHLTAQVPALAGWPTATTNNAKGAGDRPGGMNLQTAAPLAGWPTAQANDAEKRGSPTRPEGSQSCLPTAVPALTGWTAPSARDWKDTPGMATERPDGKGRQDQLPRQAYLAGWPTCRAEDSESVGTRHSRGVADTVVAVARLMRETEQIPHGPARLTVFGEMLIGSTAQMGGGGQLNPEHSRWLMACPVAWGRLAPGWSDYVLWQALIAIVSDEPKHIGSAL